LPRAIEGHYRVIQYHKIPQITMMMTKDYEQPQITNNVQEVTEGTKKDSEGPSKMTKNH
jgi:hypothetical protein